MVRALVIVPLLVACSFKPPGTTAGTTGDDDGGNDHLDGGALVDANPLCPGIGLDMPTVCMTALPTSAIELTDGGDIATSSDARCDPKISRYCVVEATAITVSNSLGVGGDRPLVLMATESITISGGGAYIDVSSQLGTMDGDHGPGSDGGMCNAGTPASGDGPYGGGAGGSLGLEGGDAGDGFGKANSKGTAGAPSRPTVLQGGCPGQDGAGGTGGTHGHGGGAIYLVAPAITLGMGVKIDASGGSAYGGNANQSGGGGGGSGGMIVFDTDHLMISNVAQVFANGGAGGEGTGGNKGGDGIDTMFAAMPALGGKGGSTQGGDGGNGGFGGTAAGAGNDAVTGGGGTGGGGGGGSVGWILVYRTDPLPASTNISPAMTH